MPKNVPKSMFWKKLPFWGEKMHFTPKQKLFQKLWAIVKWKKNEIFKKNLLGVLGVHEYGYFGLFCQFWDPTDPPQNNIFWNLIFFYLFYNSSKFLEQLLFWVKCIFLPQKSNFPKNMDFGAFFGNIHIIKALNFQIKGA